MERLSSACNKVKGQLTSKLKFSLGKKYWYQRSVSYNGKENSERN